MPKDQTKYYLTIFRLEGHERWRAFLGRSATSFDDVRAHDNWPEVTEKKVIRIDRMTGELMMKDI